MKKLMLLSVVVAFALLGTQAFASPPIAPPVEGFVIHSYTEVVVDPLNDESSFTENESFSWTYFEGWGEGPFYPNGYIPAPAHMGTTNQYCTTNNCLPTVDSGLVSELGFREGAEIKYEQAFNARDGNIEFVKTFDAKSNIKADENNLVVNKKIQFESTLGGTAEHSEKVGMSVISMGAKDSTIMGSIATGFLTLCPWAADQDGSSVTGGGYPPTNEAIAAGSEFRVTRLVDFQTDTVVNTTLNPFLSYDVDAPDGDGDISAAFIVELWEGPKGYVWAPIPLWKNTGTAAAPNWEPNDICIEGSYQCKCDQRAIIQNGLDPYAVWQLPQDAYGSPPLASYLTYSEQASASGTWSFTKRVSYESVMPSMGVAAASTFPFERINP